MATRLDGRVIRDARTQELAKRVASLSTVPALMIIQVGDRADSTAYIEQKKKLGTQIGIEVTVRRFPVDVSEQELLAALGEENRREEVSGIIVQLPLPEHLSVFRVIEGIDPARDVDGLTAVNVKKLQAGDTSGLVPATAKGIGSLLEAYNISVAGAKVTVVGRSMLVGKPTAQLLLARDATVTVAHSRTGDLAAATREADILIVATGAPGLIGAEHVRAGQVVVDVGINLMTGEQFEEEIPGKTFVGDVAFEEVEGIVAAISPVPGGVGPMTVLSLFENCVEAHERKNSRAAESQRKE
ncbi:MAG: bifunctional 5,10-methylenetetrahydrofolate dehydrogenase/5,10-methenyltetrahydrofolate cyclohydrolase [Candidatus Paceibacterota bacterium]